MNMPSHLPIQQEILRQIREKLPSNLSFVDELAESLNISNDSAYRRIRGETHLTLDEVRNLSLKYQISLDSLFDVGDDSIMFKYRGIDREKFTFEHYLASILKDLKNLRSLPDKDLIYAAKDTPIFYYFMYRELAAFKIFFWLKTIYHIPEYETKAFSFDEVSDSLLDLAQRIWKLYIHIPSLEIWSIETINVTLKQIHFYHESGLFKNPGDRKILYQRCMQLLTHVQNQAEKGFKYDLGKDDQQCSSFRLYYNEVTISDNTILFRLGDKYRAHVPSNILSILTTMNDEFCRQALETIGSIIKNSTLISEYASKERNRFFQKLRNKIPSEPSHPAP